jgi:hypothetical protein
VKPTPFWTFTVCSHNTLTFLKPSGNFTYHQA